MKFEPIPKNDFRKFTHLYFLECRKVLPTLEAIVGKWNFEDLIPGMSDFDTRLIFADGMDVEQWIEMSALVGKVHLNLCVEHPEWARILEHTPGINITWEEMLNKQFYYPEFLQWSFYAGNEERFNSVVSELQMRGWSEKDETYHLEKFFTYFGPYIRGIDPPINLGKFENKYPLHSRMMHYFLPPLQSAVSIITKRTIRGKMETLRMANKIVPQLKCIDKILNVVEKHYEIPQMYQDSPLKKLEKDLEDDLQTLFQAMRKELTVVPADLPPDPAVYKRECANIPVDIGMQLFSSLKFSRTIKGRLYFYASIDKHFSTTWLIENELNRIGDLFFVYPLKKYWEHTKNGKEDDVLKILSSLQGELFNSIDIAVLTEFHRRTTTPYKNGEQKKIALEIANVFDDFLRSINKLVVSVSGMSGNYSEAIQI